MTASLLPTKPLQISLFSERRKRGVLIIPRNEMVPGWRVSNAGRRQLQRRHTEGRALFRDQLSPTLSLRCQQVLFSSESKQNTWPTDFWSSAFPCGTTKVSCLLYPKGDGSLRCQTTRVSPFPVFGWETIRSGDGRIPECHGQSLSSCTPL